MKNTNDKWAVAFYPNDDKDGPYRQVLFRKWLEASSFAATLLNSKTTSSIMIVALPQDE